MSKQCEVTKGIQVNGGGAKEQNRRKGSWRCDVKNEITLQTRQRKKNAKDGVCWLNRKTEQAIEKEEKTRARLRGKPQIEELFDSRLSRVKARSKTFTADFLIPTSGFTGRRGTSFLDESLCSKSVNQSHSHMQENKGEKISSEAPRRLASL